MNVVWIIFALYIIGIPVVGIPLGHFSLVAWKHPHRKIGFWLFPGACLFGGVGKDNENASTAPLLRGCGVTSSSFRDDTKANLNIRAKYIALTAIYWPFRVLWNILGVLFAGITVAVISFFEGVAHCGARCMMRCKRCLLVE